MADLSEVTFKWRCPRCETLIEETNPSQLAVEKYRHERTCRGFSGREEHRNAEREEDKEAT